MNKSVRDTSNKKGLSGRGLVALVLLLSAFLSACQTASLPFPWPGGAARAPAGQLPEAQRDAKRDVVPASRSPSSSRRAPSQPEQLPLGEPVETAAPSRPSPAAPSAPLSAPPPSPPLTAPDRQTADAEPGWPPTFDDMPARSQRPPGDIALVEPSRESPAPPSFTPLLNRPVPPQTAPQGAQPEVVPAMPPPPPMKTSSVRVALLLPLSGPNAQIGEAMLNAAQLALFSFSDKSFELLVHDTKGTPEGAADAARFAIADGARLILGPLLSASVKAVTPAARAANVPVVAFSSDKSVAGDGAFTMGFIPSAEVWRVVRFARSRGVQRFAALAPDTPYGRTVIEDFRQAVERNGAVATRVEFYDPHTEDYTALVREFADYDSRRAALLAQRAELKARDDEVSKRALDRLERLQTLGPLPFDALFLADGGKRLQAIAALLPFYDIDP
ncbi:MAG: penicillin-binding protein activator, partial [Rhodospirillales bacterium]